MRKLDTVANPIRDPDHSQRRFHPGEYEIHTRVPEAREITGRQSASKIHENARALLSRVQGEFTRTRFIQVFNIGQRLEPRGIHEIQGWIIHWQWRGT